MYKVSNATRQLQKDSSMIDLEDATSCPSSNPTTNTANSSTSAPKGENGQNGTSNSTNVTRKRDEAPVAEDIEDDSGFMSAMEEDAQEAPPADESETVKDSVAQLTDSDASDVEMTNGFPSNFTMPPMPEPPKTMYFIQLIC